ncbi:MAG: hypothetical protein ACI9O3_000371 [Colwellia sp.]|jgi:hypothetical protein|uniref:DUF3581 family protein n=1 Tax=unclassified Colwellia TaxID=196834 RepID=UPI0015F76FA7|nr:MULTISPECIES: DUF3581 family protein [unclassified Colwellia]MBA6250685.1 DUF3581 domain-containing protein [Colwellia sp. MB3u-55]MBA6398094.1 DUF3581 domain-containing protein [Colwellia sp. BRX10-4]
MFLESYCNITNNQISFSRQQGSDFAKIVADDFNPLHDADAKRFCVPGDLLFSLVLEKSGLSQNMGFTFSGMVTDGIKLNFPEKIVESATILDDNAKEYMKIEASGQCTTNRQSIDALIRAYVEFSGHTFPHILVKLMFENNVMINPTRPMVMYENMFIHLDEVDFTDVQLKLTTPSLLIDGKRGKATLPFDLVANGKVIGHGKKHMLLSGLRDYDQTTIDSLVNHYNDKKAQYLK